VATASVKKEKKKIENIITIESVKNKRKEKPKHVFFFFLGGFGMTQK
jgi:hypothetical protein